MVYTLLDLRRRKLAVRCLVRNLERLITDVMADFGITAAGKMEAPGVYVGDAILASIGLRVKSGCSYHGLALNVDMDLSPFQQINPCGFEGLPMTQVSELVPGIRFAELQAKLTEHCQLIF
ncbi:MAG: hypothetical protein DHS20C10_11250 [marine bacterium B5-7]|nr:MAG: hypothetical protein DHS20C10_11250 [marine bacterium B5-7]